jgi:peptidyl-Asp metalloendopeptidase
MKLAQARKAQYLWRLMIVSFLIVVVRLRHRPIALWSMRRNRSRSFGFATSAFQATARSCAIGNLSYPHEHGHNLGLTHDPGNGNGSNSLFPIFGFGHFVSGSFRTVMSYSNNCIGGCTRAPYFSNPNVSYRSAPTGIADQRDNARAGNITAPDVANFRASLGIVFASGFE